MPATLKTAIPGASSVPDLVNDYLSSCPARGLSLRTMENASGFALNRIFFPGAAGRESPPPTTSLSPHWIDSPLTS